MPGPQSEKRILIVDDEPRVADTAAAIFASAGFSSRAVYTAEEALELFPRWTPHLAVIDVHLPGMSGIDLAIHLKSEYPACKLTLFSGFIDSAELLESARREGHSFDVLAKPVPPTELLQLASDPLPMLGEA